MDIQGAIKNLESTFEAKSVLSGEITKMAILALQEQAEREKGCKYCQGEYNVSTFSVARHTSDDATIMSIETLYCPHWGKRLNKEKVCR